MDFARLIRPLAVRVSNLVARAVVSLVDDSKKMQLLQASVLDGETRDDVERVQNYGFTSVPLEGAEAVVLFVGGRRDHGLAIAVDDRRYRIRNLESGEVAVYDSSGSTLVLKANGDIEITPASGTVTLAGDLDVSGTVTASTDVVGGGKSLKNHTHSVSGTVSTAPGAVTFAPAGTTGAPS